MQGLGNQNVYRQEVPPQIPLPVQVDQQANSQPLMDGNMIAKAIRQYFGVQLRPLDRPVRKPYSNWVNRIPLPKDYKTLHFFTFSDENGKSTVENVSRFTA